jgi:hypothetical protein
VFVQLAVVVLQPGLENLLLLRQAVLHVDEADDAAEVAALQVLEILGISFFLLDGLDELVDVGLLLVEVLLEIVFEVHDVALLHVAVLLYQLVLELLVQAVVHRSERLNVLVVVRQLDLLPDYGEVRAGLNVGVLLVKACVSLWIIKVIFGAHD